MNNKAYKTFYQQNYMHLLLASGGGGGAGLAAARARFCAKNLENHESNYPE